MSLGDYCEKAAATIRKDETVRAAARQMRDEGVGTLVVVEDGRPTGIVTDRDLVLDTLCSRSDPGALTVDEIASRPVVTIGEDESLREAARQIRRHGLRRLPVVDDEHRLVGIVAADDLFSLATAELNAAAGAIRTQCPGDCPVPDVAARTDR
jgi:CBS domain-containing protein